MTSETRNYPRQLGNRLRVYTTSGGFTQVFPIVPVDVTGGSYTRISTSTPGFRSAFLKGKSKDLPMNPFSFESTWRGSLSGFQKQRAVDLVTGAWTTDDTIGLYPEEGTIITTPAKISSVMLDQKLRAARKFRSALKDQDLNVPVAVLEGHKTIKMIADLATQLARAGLALRRGSFSGAAQALGVSPRGGPKKRRNYQDLAGNWLELQYGWRPVLNDIYGYASYLARLDSEQLGGRIRLSKSSVRKTSSKSSSMDAVGIHVLHEEAIYVVRYIVYFGRPPGINPGTALGLSNPAAVVYELVPFSFIADWIFPLGSFLENLDAEVGAQFIKGCETQFYKGSSRGRVVSRPPTQNGNVRTTYNTLKEVMIDVVSVTRTPLTGFPANHFPIMQNPLSGAHAATAFALVAQVFSGAPVKHLRI